MKRALLLAFAVSGLWAQNPGAQADPADQNQPQERRREVYVRRLSAGVFISANLPGLIKNEVINQSFTTTPPVAVTSTATNKSSMVGFGIVIQGALTDKWAVAIAPTIRHSVRFEATTVRLVGNDNPNTVQDDREGTTLIAKNSARFLEVPLLVRHYNKSRFERGPRYFFEIGPRVRIASNVRTTTEVTPPPSKGDKFTLNDTVDFRRQVLGATAGFGLQFVDDFGIRFVPEVRYTRWFGKNFGDITGRSRQNQIEIIFALTF